MTISIIIPVYNAAAYLAECLDSVIAAARGWIGGGAAQGRHIEIVCVDDGSTDGSGALLDEYCAALNMDGVSMTALHQSNAGVSAARNKALDNATGEWVWFVDADDLVHPRVFECFGNLAEAFPGAKTICVTEFLSGEAPPVHWPELSSIEKAHFVTKHNGEALKCHRRVVCAALIRREEIGSIRFEPYIMGEDMLFLSRIFWKTDAWVLSATPVYFYRKHAGSAIAKTSFRNVRDGLETEIAILDLIADNREKWAGQSMDEFFKFTRTFSWTTFGGMFFKLPKYEMQSLLSKWIDLQHKHQSLFRETFYRRIVVGVVGLFRSAFLCKLLVIGGRRFGW